MNAAQPALEGPRRPRLSRSKLLVAGCLLFIVVLPLSCIASILLPLLPGPESIWHPQWSPAGDYLAFNCLFLSPESLRYYIEYPEDILYLRDRFGDVCLTDRAGAHLERLSLGGSASSASWSPDGTMLAWRQQSTLHTWDIRTATKESLEIPGLSVLNGQLEWSLDGSHLFMDSAAIDVATGHLTTWSGVGSEDLEYGFTHSRDGAVLAYYQYRQGILESPTLIIERGSNQQALLDGPRYRFRSISLFPPSPRGTYLSWIGHREWGEGDTLYLYRVASADLYSFSLNPQWQVSDLAWSQDEGYLALQTHSEIHILPLSSPEPFAAIDANTLTTSVSLVQVDDWTISGGLSWAEDAGQIAVSLGHDIWVVDLEEETIKPLLKRQHVSFQHRAGQARVRIRNE